jgi:hypothetical protein
MATSLFDWIMHLLRNPEAREHFQADPKAAMASAGMSSVCGDDVRDAKAFLLDHPAVNAVRQDQSVHSAQGDGASRAVHALHGDGAPPSAPAHEHINHILKHYVAEPGVRHDHHRVENIHRNHESTRIHESSRVGTDQHDSRVAHDQITLGGRGNLMGDGNDSSEHRFAHIDDHSDNSAFTHIDDHASRDDHGFRASVSGNGSGGRDFHDTRSSVSGNGSAGRDFHDTRTSVSGNGSAGRDIHAEKSGAVLGQGVAGGDIDHTGGLAGLDHTVSVGNIDLLSGLVNTGDVLNGSPVLSGDLNNSLNHSLNHAAQGSLDDLVHNTDVHHLHDLVTLVHAL